MKFEILYHFSEGPVHLIETKRVGLPASATPGEIYQWHFVEEDSVYLLAFEAMNIKLQTRVFSEGSVILGNNSCRGEIRGKSIELTRHDRISDRLMTLLRKSLETKTVT
jgi:hypothetical protein